MALTGNIITKDECIIIPMYFVSDIYAALREFYGVVYNEQVPFYHKMNYNLFEIIKIYMNCCEDMECNRKQLGIQYLEKLEVMMRAVDWVLFAARPVTNFEISVYREMISAFENGWEQCEATFWLVGNQYIEMPTVKKI